MTSNLFSCHVFSSLFTIGRVQLSPPVASTIDPSSRPLLLPPFPILTLLPNPLDSPSPSRLLAHAPLAPAAPLYGHLPLRSQPPLSPTTGLRMSSLALARLLSDVPAPALGGPRRATARGATDRLRHGGARVARTHATAWRSTGCAHGQRRGAAGLRTGSDVATCGHANWCRRGEPRHWAQPSLTCRRTTPTLQSWTTETDWAVPQIEPCAATMCFTASGSGDLRVAGPARRESSSRTASRTHVRAARRPAPSRARLSRGRRELCSAMLLA